MDDSTIAQFSSITSASAEQAEQYLTLTEGNLEQAILLFFEDPGLAPAAAPTSSTAPPPQPQPQPITSLPRKRKNYPEDDQGVIRIDSEDEDEDSDDVEMIEERPAPAAGPDTTDDAEFARRLQEEMYGGAESQNAAGVRAPIERVRQTLVGGDDYDDEDVSAMIQEQIRNRERRIQSRPGIFNQRDTQSVIWSDNSAESAANPQRLSFATGGASDRSAKASSLAEMFRPPFEIIERLAIDEAREEGKEREKWLLVNVQDPSIFDCQVLNRDLWKDKDVRDVIKEHFIFLQYSNDDPRGAGYIQYYFANSQHDASAYPHIAILDPRTGERVKVWSGPPAPKPADFIMQIYEFLDRYSLHEDAKNPVAKRKPERTKVDVDRMTEEQMLEMALQNSLANASGAGPADDDPDELTKSINMGKGKGKVSDADAADAEASSANGTTLSPFAAISSNRPHVEPANDPASTTRIQFRYSGGRVVRRFALQDPVRRIYEWLKAEPLEGMEGLDFDIMLPGKNLINSLDQTVETAGLKNASVMVEFARREE